MSSAQRSAQQLKLMVVLIEMRHTRYVFFANAGRFIHTVNELKGEKSSNVHLTVYNLNVSQSERASGQSCYIFEFSRVITIKKKITMNQTNKSKITQKLGESFQQHLEAYETELAMGNLSIAQVMKTQSMHLKILEALQKKGPEIIELNENDESMNPVMPIMRAITSTVNLGQTCYANAVVFYSLRFIPLFTEKLHKWVKKSVGNMPRKGKQVLEIFQVLHAEYIAMAGSERRDDLWSQFEEAVECAHDTSMFLCVLRELAPQFVKNEPNDSAALLIKMLEWLKYCSDILRAENG